MDSTFEHAAIPHSTVLLLAARDSTPFAISCKHSLGLGFIIHNKHLHAVASVDLVLQLAVLFGENAPNLTVGETVRMKG